MWQCYFFSFHVDTERAGPHSNHMTNTNTAIDTVHVQALGNGQVALTTWHDTRAFADERVEKASGATWSRVFDERGGCLGNYRAVTWHAQCAHVHPVMGWHCTELAARDGRCAKHAPSE